MTWSEFSTLLAGLNSESPLGHIVTIRAENDKEKLKNFSPHERKIRNEWRTKHRQIITDKESYSAAMAGFQNMFKSLSTEGA